MNHKRQIQECVLNIDMTHRSMYLSYMEMKKLKLPLNSVVYGDMIRYAYIQLCSILDEFKVLNGLAEDDAYLRDTLYVLAPVLKAIKKYTGIPKARNIMLAHFNRDKQNKFHPWWIALKELNLPRTQKEINQIYVWLGLTVTILTTRYITELEEISNVFRKEVEEYSVWVTEQENNAVKNQNPLDNLFHEVEMLCEEKQIGNLVIDPSMTELIEIFSKKVKG